MNKLYQLNDLLSELEQKQDDYFIDLITTRSIQAGIILLHAIKRGTYIFVHAGSMHNFHGNSQDLVIFYALGR